MIYLLSLMRDNYSSTYLINLFLLCYRLMNLFARTSIPIPCPRSIRRFLGQAPQRHQSRPAQTQTNAARPTSEFDRLHRSLPPLPLAAGAPRRHDRERIRHHHHLTKVGYRNRRRIEYPPHIIVPTSPCSFCASTSPPTRASATKPGGDRSSAAGDLTPREPPAVPPPFRRLADPLRSK
ncbi:hypothetical protein PAHAL_1G376100 [Panicum hallii]|uniref:Uncharacterized protein n=1 Tax=Panicum hallii TaxID=206008 RepID=A0A2T8KXH7_9POAL|nr:hypothetical protein PAHAL_1G376100 [Panicum hallii]